LPRCGGYDRSIGGVDLEEHDGEDDDGGDKEAEARVLDQVVDCLLERLLDVEEHPLNVAHVRLEEGCLGGLALLRLDDDVPQLLGRRGRRLCRPVPNNLLPPLLEEEQVTLIQVLLPQPLPLIVHGEGLGVAVHEVVPLDLVLLEQEDLDSYLLVLCVLKVLHDECDEDPEHQKVGHVEVDDPVEDADDVPFLVPALNVLEI